MRMVSKFGGKYFVNCPFAYYTEKYILLYTSALSLDVNKHDYNLENRIETELR